MGTADASMAFLPLLLAASPLDCAACSGRVTSFCNEMDGRASSAALAAAKPELPLPLATLKPRADEVREEEVEEEADGDCKLTPCSNIMERRLTMSGSTWAEGWRR